MSWWNNLQLSHNKKTLDEMWLGSEEESTDLTMYTEKVQETEHNLVTHSKSLQAHDDYPRSAQEPP